VPEAATLEHVRRVVGVLLLTAMVPGLLLVGCSKKKEQPVAVVKAWFKVAEARQKAAATSTTTTPPARVTTTIPATTSTMPPLVRLALSKAFQEAAEARRLAEQRCAQLRQGC
jgi:hypothetical protein